MAIAVIQKMTLQGKLDIIQQVEANPNTVFVQMLM
jgi:hypothetical protein